MCAGIRRQLSQSKEEQCHSTGSQKCDPRDRVKPLRELHASGTASRSHLLHFWLLHRTHLLSQWRWRLYRKNWFLTQLHFPSYSFMPTWSQAKRWPYGPRSQVCEATEGRGNWTKGGLQTSSGTVASAKERSRLTLKTPGCIWPHWQNRKKEQENKSKQITFDLEIINIWNNNDRPPEYHLHRILPKSQTTL